MRNNQIGSWQWEISKLVMGNMVMGNIVIGIGYGPSEPP